MAPRPARVCRWRCRAISASPPNPARSPPPLQRSASPAITAGTYFLTQLLGSARARELYLLSPVLTAKEAHAIGMVTKVVSDAEIDMAAHELALSLAQGPSIALGFIKRNINNAEHLALEDCFDGEAIHHTRCSDTEDHKEAAKAFVEKRKPTFKGA
ncbi:enoyl-CoA hydratase/carnithine racemase [Bradyrhizobium sp. LM6.9]